MYRRNDFHSTENMSNNHEALTNHTFKQVSYIIREINSVMENINNLFEIFIWKMLVMQYSFFFHD